MQRIIGLLRVKFRSRSLLHASVCRFNFPRYLLSVRSHFLYRQLINVIAIFPVRRCRSVLVCETGCG